MSASALYRGQVYHQRLLPTQHAFSYEIFLFWLALDELDELCHEVVGLRQSGLAPVRFRRADYLGDPKQPLADAALEKMSELAGQSLVGRVFMLGQLRMLGFYFSPVNFYYLQQQDGHFSHLLAEVSNTPWNQRHYYLVDLAQQHNTPKAFHVSPFNPMDMEYAWQVAQPAGQLTLRMNCLQGERHFVAGLNLTRRPLNSAELARVMISIPSMALKTVIGIYWQALKLFVKGTPIYDHPDKKRSGHV